MSKQPEQIPEIEKQLTDEAERRYPFIVSDRPTRMDEHFDLKQKAFIAGAKYQAALTEQGKYGLSQEEFQSFMEQFIYGSGWLKEEKNEATQKIWNYFKSHTVAPNSFIYNHGEIKEGDYCICNYSDSALKFWYGLHGKILKVSMVQKIKNTPNKLKFENVYSEQTFYANSFTKVHPYQSTHTVALDEKAIREEAEKHMQKEYEFIEKSLSGPIVWDEESYCRLKISYLDSLSARPEQHREAEKKGIDLAEAQKRFDEFFENTSAEDFWAFVEENRKKEPTVAQPQEAVTDETKKVIGVWCKCGSMIHYTPNNLHIWESYFDRGYRVSIVSDEDIKKYWHDCKCDTGQQHPQSKPEEEQQRWVSVKSGELPQKDLRLPSVSDVVLVVPLNTMSTMGYYDFGLKLWYTTSSKRIIVTHWMPLPPPPITPKEGSQTK